MRNTTESFRWFNHDAATTQTFAYVVVTFTGQVKGDTFGKERRETLAGCPCEIHMDGIVRQTCIAVTCSNLVRQHGTHGTVGIGDWNINHCFFAVFQS